MGHPTIDNKSPFAFETLFLADEEGRPLYVPVIQASYHIRHNGSLVVAEQSPPVNLAGEFWGDPDKASMKYEPVFAFTKPATDVVLIGHAHAPSPGTTETQVGLRVGPVHKIVKVVGDRWLIKGSGQVRVTPPVPFEKIPLIYERSFGGWDTRDPNAEIHRFEPRNPVGAGFRDRSIGGDDHLRLPNVEDPHHPYRDYGDTPPPTGFGFIAPNWRPRAALAGTYDSAWDKGRKPLLPRDFDRRFFNAASPGLIAPGYLRGDEPVVVVGASPERRVSFHLPGVSSPVCHVGLRGRDRVSLVTALDTVIINMDDRVLILIWRAHLAVRNGPHDVVSVEIGAQVHASSPAVA
jgi:hypothetical protein